MGTKSYYYGRVEKQPTKRTIKRKKIDDSSVMDQDKIDWDRHQNQRLNDKIHETYINANKKLNERVGWIVEAAMKKHQKDEGGY